MIKCDICGGRATVANNEHRIFTCGRHQKQASLILYFKEHESEIPPDGWIDVENCKEAPRIVRECRSRDNELVQVLKEMIEYESTMFQIPKINDPDAVSYTHLTMPTIYYV